MTADVSVLGLGAIGTPIVRVLLAGRLRTAVWNRSPGRSGPLVAAGAIANDRIDSAAAAAPLVIVCVSDHTAARDLLVEAGAAVSGRTLVVLATGTPHEARALARWADGQGARYLDGAILAVPDTIGGPQATLLYSGSTTAFADAEPVLRLLGTPRFLGDDPARAALIDTGVLATTYALYSGFFHAGALAATSDVPATDLTAVLVPWLRTVLDLLPGFATDIDRNQYPNTISSVATNAAAVAMIRSVATDHDVTDDVLAPLHAALTRHLADGHAADGFASVFTAFARHVARRPR